jgi:hypothetical protein
MTIELLPAALPPQPATRASLASLPAGAGAVCWSEDNLLAVATSRSVVLFSAAALDGPRAIIDVPLTQVAHEHMSHSSTRTVAALRQPVLKQY